MNLKTIDYKDWTSQWSGTWSILSFSYWGNFYCRSPFSKDVDRYVDQTIIITREGKSWAYQRASMKKVFAQKLESVIEKDPGFPKKLCDNLKSATDKFLGIVDRYIGKDISFKEYNEFQTTLVDYYYPNHIEVKVVVDFLKDELLKKYLPDFEEARVHAEPVFNRSEDFMRALAKIHSKKIGYPPELILATTKNEFEKYLKDGEKLPSKKSLKKRYAVAAFIFNETDTEIITGDKMEEVEKIIKRVETEEMVRGSTAYPGKAQGKVNLVLDATKVKNFEEGSVLVAAMTRPEYLPLMKKAAAFVTDGGGILCHAAIVARELKKPCVIGTEVATKVFKSGDSVEVDADNGIVRKIV